MRFNLAARLIAAGIVPMAGVAALVDFARVARAEEVAQDAAEMTTPMAMAARQRTEVPTCAIMWIAVGVAVGGALLFILVWRFKRRLRLLRLAAEAMARGGYATRVVESGPADFVALARSLNLLASTTYDTIARLDEERKRFHAVLHAINDGVAVIDALGRVVVCNEVMRSLTRWTGDPEGRPLPDLLRAPEALEVVWGAIAGKSGVKEVTEGFARPSDLHVSNVPSVPRQMLVSASPLPGGQGAVVVVHDATEVHRLLRVRRDFVANVSHELRNPIAAIQAAAETLEEVLDQGESWRLAVETIGRQARRLGTLVADLLDLSRLESGHHGYTIRPCALRDVIGSVVGDFEDWARQKSLNMTWTTNPPDLTALCDPEGLATVLRNLLDNAVRYTRPGDSVRLEAYAKDEGAVWIEVADTGPGIEEIHLPRLFERFYRVDPGRSREAEADRGGPPVHGTGLGLAIARHAAEVMGGSLSVHSTVGRGTTFRLVLRGDG